MSDSIFSSPRIVNDLVYKTLIESTLAIPWSIDWGTKKFSYIGPQIEKVLGWKQDSWRTVEDWAMRIHENDRAWVCQAIWSMQLQLGRLWFALEPPCSEREIIHSIKSK
jgi:PAS domain-containing protein